MNRLLFFFGVLFIMFMVSKCSNPTAEIIIDNPDEVDIKLRVDDENFTIYGFDLLTLNLTHGVHRFQALTMHDSLFFDFTVYIKVAGIVNPHLATYIKWNDRYATKKKITTLNNEVFINDKRYSNVEFEVYEKQPFMVRSWDYSIFDPWEKELQFYTKTEAIRSKIYRLRAIEELWGYSMPMEETSLDLKGIDQELNKIQQKLNEIGKD